MIKQMVTVIFHFDLMHIAVGSRCSSDEMRAIQEIQSSTENAGLIGSTIRGQSEVSLVLLLPKDEKTLGDLIYWCGYGKFSYKTLWLNAVGDWRDGGKHVQ